jgi:hypothetical protein
MSVTFTCGNEDTEINVSNGNAAAFIAILDPHAPKNPDGTVGEWTGVRLDAVQKRALYLLNSLAGVKALVAPDVVEDNPGRCFFFEMGRSEEYVRNRLEAFVALFAEAQGRRQSIVWG